MMKDGMVVTLHKDELKLMRRLLTDHMIGLQVRQASDMAFARAFGASMSLSRAISCNMPRNGGE